MVFCLPHLEASLRYVIGLVSGFSAIYYFSFSLCSPPGGVALAECCFLLSELLAPGGVLVSLCTHPGGVKLAEYCYQNC